MKYLCLVYIDEQVFDALPKGAQDACVAEHLACDDRLSASGHRIASELLAAARSAVIVRHRDGEMAVRLSPFAETKEQLRGFFLIRARDLNDAIRIGSHISSAHSATIEVRPISRLGEPDEPVPPLPVATGIKYVCLIRHEEKALATLPKGEWDTLVADSAAYEETLMKSGTLIVAHALAPVASATTLRVRGGKLSLAEGPYAPTKEQLGGFILIAAKDLDDAIRVAARVPVVRLGSVEVRAVHPLTSTHRSDKT